MMDLRRVAGKNDADEIAMPLPLELIYRGLAPSAAIESRVRLCLDDLRGNAKDFASCHVLIRARSSSEPGPGSYEVRVELRLAEGSIAVERRPGIVKLSGADAGAVIARAFDVLAIKIGGRDDRGARSAARSDLAVRRGLPESTDEMLRRAAPGG